MKSGYNQERWGCTLCQPASNRVKSGSIEEKSGCIPCHEPGSNRVKSGSIGEKSGCTPCHEPGSNRVKWESIGEKLGCTSGELGCCQPS